MLDYTWQLDMWVSNFILDESLYLKRGRREVEWRWGAKN